MEIRPMTPADIPRAASTLADAFLDDPFTVWLFPADGLRERLLRSWTMQLRVLSVPRGSAFATPDLGGIALWAPPSSPPPTLRQQLRLFFPFVRILGRRLPTAMSGFRVIRRGHPSEPHWYLSTIGVAPERQRSGYGRALMGPILERADREQTITYLETFKLDNVPYYERFGFRVTGEDDVPDAGPHMWSMTRLPFAGGG
ncbi:MAG: GNAT family N-acetyltransferase [Actinomycetota bacterium]